MNIVSEYYRGIHQMERELIRDIHQGKYPAQPKGVFITDQMGDEVPSVEFVYLVSRNSRLHRTTAGAICMAKLRQAAEAMFSESHGLATAAQIEGYKRLQQDNFRARQLADAQIRQGQSGVFEITLPPAAK